MLQEDEMEKTLEVDMSEDVVTCAVPYGGVLFINNMIPHRRYSLGSSSVCQLTTVSKIHDSVFQNFLLVF